MVKKLLFFLLMHCISLQAMQGTIVLASHAKQQDSEQLILMRKQFRQLTNPLNPEKALDIDPTIQVEKVPMHSRLGVCYNYAMMHILKLNGIKREFNIIGTKDWSYVLPFFEPAEQHQQNNLVIYFIQDDEGQTIKHFGLLDDPVTMRVKSKWSITKGIYVHELFCLPEGWGEDVSIMQLRPEYRANGEKQESLVAHIVENMQESPDVKQFFFRKTRKLIACVKSGEFAKTLQLLERYPNIPIDTCDNSRQTLLMLAVVSNDYDIASLLLKYGADTKLTDYDDRTALDLARLQGNFRIIDLLKMPQIKMEDI